MTEVKKIGDIFRILFPERRDMSCDDGEPWGFLVTFRFWFHWEIWRWYYSKPLEPAAWGRGIEMQKVRGGCN